MAHKTLIGGTSYEVSGGKAMIGGTGYDIASGKTLVDGTGYDIMFRIPVTVINGNITSTGGKTIQYAEYEGKRYTDKTIYVVPGEEVRVYIRASLPGLSNFDFIVYGVNERGKRVDDSSKEYYLTVTKPSTIEFSGNMYLNGATITYT